MTEGLLVTPSGPAWHFCRPPCLNSCCWPLGQRKAVYETRWRCGDCGRWWGVATSHRFGTLTWTWGPYSMWRSRRLDRKNGI